MSNKERFIFLHDLYRAGRYGEAAATLDSVLQTTPHDPNFLHLAAQVAEAQHDTDYAIALYRRALEVVPDWVEAAFNLAKILSKTGHLDEAIALLKKPNHADHPHVQNALTQFYQQAGDLPAAILHGKKALELRPTRHDWRTRLLLLCRQVCDWRELVTEPETLLPQGAVALTDAPLLQKEAAVRYVNAQFGEMRADRPPKRRAEGARLRVGYLSSDFHGHATAHLITELFSHHDRRQFEVFIYSYGTEDPSLIRQRIRGHEGHFAELNHLSATQAAAHIRADDLDVLIDLKSHGYGEHLEILARRPAPFQIHWLGHSGTLGADFVDAILADPVILPLGNETFFTEKVLRLPHCHQINDCQRAVDIPKPRAAHDLPEDAFVLASFNQTQKITPEMFGVWCEILQGIPNSVLWLSPSNMHAPDYLRCEAFARGVDPSRLKFAANVPMDEHLARYAHVDLALDTFPFGGSAAICDALWMGTPTITLKGQSFVARVTASLLGAVGLPELVTLTPKAYRDLALGLAHDSAARADIKQHLVLNRLSLPLFDAPSFVRAFEKVLKEACAASRDDEAGPQSKDAVFELRTGTDR